MARTEAKYVMTGDKHGDYSMCVEFPDEKVPLRKGGYYLGKLTHTAMVQEMSKASALQSTTGVSIGVSVGVSAGVSVGVENLDITSGGTKSAAGVDESQSSNGKSPMESEKSDQKLEDGLVRADDNADDHAAADNADDHAADDNADDHAADDEVDEYAVFVMEENNLVSLLALPLEVVDQEWITPSEEVASEVSLSGKTGELEVKLSITAWKLAFLEHGSFRILVKVQQRWVKLEEPRSGYKEAVEDVLCVARFLASLKKEPDASEDKVRNHLLQGNVLSAAFLDRLRKRRALIEQYIDLDPALKVTDARKFLMSLIKEKAGKRVLVLSDGSDDEDDGPPEKKTKMDDPKPEDVNTRVYDSEEDFYEEEAIDDEEEDDGPGDSLCIFCDDGGYLLCCDGPCMRSFHPRRIDGKGANCKTLGFPDESDIDAFRKGWFCTNCKTKRHQCYVCGELGDSDPSLGRKRDVFVCDAASCGKFYHPKCIASKLIPFGNDREARKELAKSIRAGSESFTCPLHWCKKCGKGEDKKEKDLNLATCRRCPSAWHVKCLPRTLKFEAEEEHDEVRAWLIGKLYMVYCTDHKVYPDLGTPLRNHIKFKDKSSEPTTTISFKKPLTKVSTERHEYRSKASSAALVRSVDDPRPFALKTSEDVATRLVDDIFSTSRHKITEESVLEKLVLPSIYRRKEFNWMMQGRFDSILNGARAAVERVKQGGNWEDARLKCARDQVEAICLEEIHLRTFLAPTLHGKRYTSYGRHFTKVEKLKTVVEVLQPRIRDGDTIVDFSCGDNTFSRMLRDELSTSGKPNCRFKNFDIFNPKDTFGFVRKDWLSVGSNECGPGDNLVIGLNPPFTYMDVFISHALSMNPRVLVLIVPPLKKPILHYGYQCMLDDPTTMAEKSFYLPGSVHGLNDDHMEQANHVAPHLYIFVRSTTYAGPIPLPLDPSPPAILPMSEAPSQPSLKSEKLVRPAAAAAAAAAATTSTDPAANLFIPPQKRPQPRKKPRWSSVEDGEIRTPPLPLSPPSHLPPPPPPVRPPWRISQFHDHPHQIPQVFHHPEFRPVPPHPVVEPYSPYDPFQFASRDPRSRDPGGLSGGGGGHFPPAGFHGPHHRVLRGSHSPPFRDFPPPGHRESPPGFEDWPPRTFRDLPPPGFEDWPPRTFRDLPPPGFEDWPPRTFRDLPPPGFERPPPPPAYGGWLPEE